MGNNARSDDSTPIHSMLRCSGRSKGHGHDPAIVTAKYSALYLPCTKIFEFVYHFNLFGTKIVPLNMSLQMRCDRPVTGIIDPPTKKQPPRCSWTSAPPFPAYPLRHLLAISPPRSGGICPGIQLHWRSRVRTRPSGGSLSSCSPSRDCVCNVSPPVRDSRQEIHSERGAILCCISQRAQPKNLPW